MKSVTLALAASGAAAVLLAGGWALLHDPAPAFPPADPTDRALVADGRAVYADQCASCHGARLEGEDPDWRRRKPDGTLFAPPHDKSGHTWHHPDRDLLTIIAGGGAALAPPDFQSGMPAFGDMLEPRDISAVLAYIKSRWPAPVRARQAAVSQEASR